MNSKNSKTSEPHRFKLDLTDKLNLKNPNKTWLYPSQNTTIINLKFLLHLEMILLIYLMVLILLQTFRTLNLSLKNKNLTENPPVQIYPNKIKNRIVFKIKTGYKLELLTPETMKLLGSTKKMLIQIKIVKMYQNQNLLKLFQFIVILSSFIQFCSQQTIWTVNKYFTTFFNDDEQS